VDGAQIQSFSLHAKDETLIRIPDSVVAHIVEPLWDYLHRSVRLREWQSLKRSQWWDHERIEQLRNHRLKNLISTGVEYSPFYQKRFVDSGIDPTRVDGIRDLRILPLLTKSDIRENTSTILSRQFDRKLLIAAKTGGSTGAALEVFCDPCAAQMRGGAAIRSNEWSGWKLGQPVAATWGNPSLPQSITEHLKHILRERWFYLDTVKVTDVAIEEFVRDWKKYRPGMLFGHARSLFILAEALGARSMHLQPDGIVSTSMMLIESERQVIEDTFATPVTNRYGCEEVSLIASECECHQEMHINAEHCIVEVLDDDEEPCSAGQDGRIVVTELINRAMPMIRYEVGDRGILSDRTCSCGRKLPLLARVTGRTADFLLAADGARVAGISLIENTLTKLPGIKQMQIVQERKQHALVRLVPGDGYSEQTEAHLGKNLKHFLGENFDLDFDLVDDIAPEANGKYRFSICRI